MVTGFLLSKHFYLLYFIIKQFKSKSNGLYFVFFQIKLLF